MKTTIKNIIKEFSSDKNYFSLKQFKTFLKRQNYKYSDASIKKYLKELIDEKNIFSAGRGFYSKIPNEFIIDASSINSLIETVRQKFPLLEFSLWSTKQINFAFHHTQNKFFTFIYADKDSLIYLRDFLIDQDYSVFLNPIKSDLVKTSFNNENSLVLRNYIIHSLSNSNISPIEKILVDLFLETDRINIIDISEYSRIFEYFLTNYCLNLSALLDYAERRKNLTKIKQFLTKYTNPTIL